MTNAELKSEEELEQKKTEAAQMFSETPTHADSFSNNSDAVSLKVFTSEVSANAGSEPELENHSQQHVAMPLESKIEPLAVAKKKIQNILEQRKFHLFASLCAGLIFFTLMFGKLALITLLLWTSIVFTIAAANKLSSKFFISSDANGVLLKKKDGFGTHQLKLTWLRVQSVTVEHGTDLRPQQIILSINKDALSLPNALIFKELLQNNNIKIDAYTCADNFSQFRDDLLCDCPVDLLKKIVEKPLEPDTSSIIAYRPFQKERHLFSRLLSRHEQACVSILSVGLLSSFFIFGGHNSFTFLMGILVPLIMLVQFVKQTVLKLKFDDSGLTVIWDGHADATLSKTVPWTLVKSVSGRQRKTRNGIKDELLIYLSAKGKRKFDLVALCGVSFGLFGKVGDSFVIKLNLNDLSGSTDKQQLLSYLRKFCPAEYIDNSVNELLNPTDTVSYTKLWMDSFLKESGTRRLEGKLAAGHCLRNGQLEILKLIGAGGQANAYLAQTPCGERLVLKEFILPSHAGAEISLRSLEHIEKELNLMKKIQHSNIVQYHDLFVEDHRCYLILEHINGKSLRELVEENGPLAQEQIMDLSKQMAQILAHLHSQTPQLIHRDFTPENLILDENGVLKLIDFNVAQELEEGATKTIVGKHAYLPPEQFRGKASPQSDIYAFGATLYYLLTGEEPEPISCSHPILKNENVLPQFDVIVSRATELELSDRIKDAGELIEILRTSF